MFHKSALIFYFYEMFPTHFIYILLQQVKKIEKILKVCLFHIYATTEGLALIL